MAKNFANKGAVSENFSGIGAVSRAMIEARAKELAVIGGRSKASQADFKQAKRELSGGESVDPKDAILESAPESERWDPVAGSSGRKVPDAPNEDEDEEGRNPIQKMVEDGVNEAEHDQMLQAARSAAKKIRRS